jgi:hypothetical protein
MYITDNEIALHSFEDAVAVAKILLNNGYVTMISKEEKLYIVNYEWSPSDANRNDVAFMNREELEDIIFNTESED